MVQKLRYWVPIAAAVTVMSFLVYAAVQHNLRQSANDPQVQMAEEAALYLSKNEAPPQDQMTPKVDIAKSLGEYLIILDDKGKPIYSQVQLAGKSPVPPKGALEEAKKHGENRITWQPAPGVRSAIVVRRYEGARSGYVLAGRSLREVEARVGRLTMLVVMAWIVAMGSSALATLIFLPHPPKSKKR